MYTITQKYAHVKGFNIQPDWGRNGTEIWLNFDRTRYEEMIRIGKERFPAMNTVRIWLSFDAWIQDRQTYLQSVKAAGETLSAEGLLIIPTYFNGWFGEYMKVNAGGVVFNVSDMDRDLRILIEPAAVIVHAVEQAKKIFDFKFDSYVLVQGCGPIGLLLLAMVRCLGVRNIIACDMDEKRLAMAKRLGAAYTVNAGAPDATEQGKAITGGLGAEMLFQCTGSPKAASKAWSYVRRGGSYCELGFFVNNGDTTYNPHLDLCNKEVKVIGSWTYQAQDWIQSFSFLKEAQDRGLPITDLLTHKYPLDKMNEAMEMNISMEGLKIAFVAED